MRILVLLAGLTGCQEYGLQEPPDSPELPIPTPPPPTPVDTGDVVPVAEAPVYANTRNQLFEVDPLTGNRTLVGTFRTAAGQAVDGMTDIAIDNDGRMYGGTFDGLYSIDPTTGVSTLVCGTDIEMMGLAFTPDGSLLAAGDTVINRVSLDTCTPTPVVFNTPFETSGDLVGLPDGYLYWTVWEEDDVDGLVRIDPNNWSIQYIGTISVDRLFGLGYADEQLFGFSDNGETVAVTPSQNAGVNPTVLLSSDSDVSWWGATTNPVAW